MKYSAEHIDELIAKVLAGEAAGIELQQLNAWKGESQENQAYFEISERMFGQIDQFKIHHQVDSVKAWNKLNARITENEQSNEETKIIPLFKRPVFIRAAASLIVVFVLALIVNYVGSSNSVEMAPVILASQETVTKQDLPDGSKITLNKHSELAYVLTNKNVRQVKLKGEAFFEVTHNEELPFEIMIDEVIIKDIGTAFNVRALPESNTIEVLVESGEVYFY
jgi:transmembrane sensor